ncbi:hypothetical protein [Nocardia sp. NPDC051463]|uniref:hypothetical protein n=1 Tax=Nocardia sp. NPDC051463 TaxID=3154845 RepID=UPI00343AF28F
MFCMMWQPWMKASNWDGAATVNAFGSIKRTTNHLNLWSVSAPSGARMSGQLAIFATVAIFVMVAAAIQTILHGSETAGGITAVAAIVVAALVLTDVLTLDSKMPQVQASLGMAHELGPQLGLVVGALRGTSAYPWPGEKVALPVTELTPWAFASAAVAFGLAALMVVKAWRGSLRRVVAALARLM